MVNSHSVLLRGLAWESVRGFAETRTTRSLVASAALVEDCQAVIEFSRSNGLSICSRGAGYTYGDMILNDGHIVLDLSRMNKILHWDEQTGQVVVQPSVRFAEIFRIALPKKWALGSCPGGMGVTIGGALSNNVHGKDSWKIGNFGSQVVELKLLTANGDIVTVNKSATPKVFQAIVGGMGLLGIIVEVTLQLRKVPSGYVEITSIPARNIHELIELLEQVRGTSDFFVAWVDAFAAGSHLGRGFVTMAKWLEADLRVDSQRLTDSLTMSTRLLRVLPAKPTWSALRPFFGPASIQMANAMHYRIATLRGMKKQVMLFTEYNFMHNKIPDWKHIYHPHGFLEFQPIIPRVCGVEAIAHVFELCQRFHCQSLLCGMKAHSADDFLLSYSGDGYSMGVDIQLRGRRRAVITEFANRLFQYTLDCGGKVFLAKDELLPRHIFERMYPRYQEFVQVKQEIDPEPMFMSDMYRRLLA